MGAKNNSVVDAKTAWRGKDIRLTLLGRKHRNGVLFTESWPMAIDDVNGTVSLADLIRECLGKVETDSEIPADLIEGVELRFIK